MLAGRGSRRVDRSRLANHNHRPLRKESSTCLTVGDGQIAEIWSHMHVGVLTEIPSRTPVREMVDRQMDHQGPRPVLEALGATSVRGRNADVEHPEESAWPGVCDDGPRRGKLPAVARDDGGCPSAQYADPRRFSPCDYPATVLLQHSNERVGETSGAACPKSHPAVRGHERLE